MKIEVTDEMEQALLRTVDEVGVQNGGIRAGLEAALALIEPEGVGKAKGVDYKETVVPDGDSRSEVLELLCEGNPWALIIATFPNGDAAMDLKLEIGGGMHDVETVRSLLTKTLRALP